MTATLPRHKQRNPPGAIQAMCAIALVCSPALVKSQLDHRARAAVANEYESDRPLILSSIESAALRRDLGTLLRIQDRYAGCVADHQFKSTLQAALAEVNARETTMELAIAKHLDFTRHREEVSIPLTAGAQLVKKDDDKQVLSVLPH